MVSHPVIFGNATFFSCLSLVTNTLFHIGISSYLGFLNNTNSNWYMMWIESMPSDRHVNSICSKKCTDNWYIYILRAIPHLLCKPKYLSLRMLIFLWTSLCRCTELITKQHYYSDIVHVFVVSSKYCVKLLHNTSADCM